jgi:hypothetical protein
MLLSWAGATGGGGGGTAGCSRRRRKSPNMDDGCTLKLVAWTAVVFPCLAQHAVAHRRIAPGITSRWRSGASDDMPQRAGSVPPDIDQQRHAGMWLLGQGCCDSRQSSPINLASTRAPLAQTAEPFCVSPEHTKYVCALPANNTCGACRVWTPGLLFLLPIADPEFLRRFTGLRVAGAARAGLPTLLRAPGRRRDPVPSPVRATAGGIGHEAVQRGGERAGGLGGRLARCGFCGKPWEWETSKG